MFFLEKLDSIIKLLCNTNLEEQIRFEKYAIISNNIRVGRPTHVQECVSFKSLKLPFAQRVLSVLNYAKKKMVQKSWLLKEITKHIFIQKVCDFTYDW